MPPGQQTGPDPHCDAAWRNREKPGCGLGAEIGVVLPILTRLRKLRLTRLC